MRSSKKRSKLLRGQFWTKSGVTVIQLINQLRPARCRSSLGFDYSNSDKSNKKLNLVKGEFKTISFVNGHLTKNGTNYNSDDLTLKEEIKYVKPTSSWLTPKKRLKADTLQFDSDDDVPDKFEMSMMGVLTLFLGLQVRQLEDRIFINQAKYTRELLKKFRMESCSAASTTMDSSSTLDKDEDGQYVKITAYQGIIGSLLYLTANRPDILFVVVIYGRF
ncbi:uncharacterized protein LOC124935089 [Impatiens glandulifera]|uniref:uncharacterized protein LOC124935089 n=1 Tax=Impatiens glandulifera TaxID=253017 RepID=UPI001FB0C45E|nr:uncharacterized protein LOC124935089 [Impatiens glandulifera]